MGTPFLLTDKTKAVQWSGVSEPYGRVASSSGSVAQNVRLPGQYDDGAGLFHNGFRDYSPGSLKDPRIGYFEADPIRLAGGLNVYAYVGGKPTRFVDPMGTFPMLIPVIDNLLNFFWGGDYVPKDCNCPSSPAHPSCSSVDDNIEETQKHISPFWFYQQVRNHGVWDYKQQGGSYQDFGNFNYGATASSFGFPDSIILRMGGWAQIQAGTSTSGWGSPFDWGLSRTSFGDDPQDQAQILRGMKYAKCGCGK